MEDNALAEIIYSDAFKMMHLAALRLEGIAGDEDLTTLYGCDQVIVDTESEPKTVTIDFRFLGCEVNGVERKGRIIGAFSGQYPDSGSGIAITFTNYIFEDQEVDGRLTIINKGQDYQGTPTLSFYLQKGEIGDDRGQMTWSASHTWRVIKTDWDNPENEIYRVDGTSNGVNKKGNVFNTEITLSNQIQGDCIWPNYGTTRVDIRNLSTRIVDYGRQECDHNANVSINGGIYPIEMAP